MTQPGKSKTHSLAAVSIRQAISYSLPSEAIALIQETDMDIADEFLRTPLMHAASKGKSEIVLWLLKRGAKIDLQDSEGFSALHLAIQGKHATIVESLLEEGANVELRDIHGNTPLWRATFDARGKYDLVKLLIKHSASCNSKNNANRSPLDFAEQIADHDLTKILLGDG